MPFLQSYASSLRILDFSEKFIREQLQRELIIANSYSTDYFILSFLINLIGIAYSFLNLVNAHFNLQLCVFNKWPLGGGNQPTKAFFSLSPHFIQNCISSFSWKRSYLPHSSSKCPHLVHKLHPWPGPDSCYSSFLSPIFLLMLEGMTKF